MASCPVIFGCAGLRLTPGERDFFADVKPAGFILFAHNCDSPEQIRRLTEELRGAVGRARAPVLVDQEGGRVQRLKPPRWRAAPPAGRFAALAEPDTAREGVRINARLIGDDLAALGINVDCAPVLDLRLPETHEAIGDRAFGSDPARVAELGRAVCEGLIDAGVQPVIKHIPGHGRARSDSHKDLPRVAAGKAELESSDFEAFRRLADVTWAMTAHIVYEAIDPDRPATVSPKLIREVIRGFIGFEGVLLSDDLSMEALSGSIGARAEAALSAGCDLALHCNGKLDEMIAVAEAAGRTDPLSMPPLVSEQPPLEPDARAALQARLDAILAGG